MPSFNRSLLFAAAVAGLAATSCFADEIKTNTMAAEPMKTDQMSTNAMSANPVGTDPMKADCIEKAQMETDAARKETMLAECDAMAGGMMMMKPGTMAPQQ